MENILDLIVSRNYKRAREIALRKFDSNPEFYYYYIGLSFCHGGDYRKAIDYFKLSEAFGLKNHLLHYNLGVAYLGIMDYKRAAERFKYSIICNSKLSSSYINLAYAHYKSGDLKSAYRIVKYGYAVTSNKRLEEIEGKLLNILKKSCKC